MISPNLKSPNEIAMDIASQFRTRRLNLNWSQKTLASRSGVSLGTIKKFEHTGKIGLIALLQMALVMRILDAFERLIDERKLRVMPRNTQELLKEDTRKRGRM